MALCQLVNQGFQSPDVCYRTIRDFLAAADGIDDFTPSGPNPGPGYEIADASYASGDPADTTAGDWCVLKSSGEAGTYPHYLLFTFGTLVHKIVMYPGWDATTHRGTGPINGYEENIYHNGAGLGTLYIHADLDEIHIIIRPQATTTYYRHPFGRLKPDHLFYDGEAVRVAGAIGAGANVTLNLPVWPGWARAGGKIYNWDANDYRELTITAASEAARTITAAQAWDMSPGSWLAEDVFFFVGINRYHAPGGGYASVYGRPSRSLDASQQIQYALNVCEYMPGNDIKYGERVLADIWVARQYYQQGEMRGRLALARGSHTALGNNEQGVAWTDENGENWRIYSINSQRVIAFREAY